MSFEHKHCNTTTTALIANSYQVCHGKSAAYIILTYWTNESSHRWDRTEGVRFHHATQKEAAFKTDELFMSNFLVNISGPKLILGSSNYRK